MISRAIPAADLRLHNGRLLLTPEDPMAAAPSQTLSERLREAGLIATASSAGTMRFAPGDRFFDYVGFTGCAVHVGPGSDGATGLDIEIEGPFEAPALRRGRETRPPRCPQCRRTLPDWLEQMEQTTNGAQAPVLCCTGCGTKAPGWRWTWGRLGGFGRLFIRLEPVFPGEGRPLPALFRLLEQLGLGPWHYFSVQD